MRRPILGTLVALAACLMLVPVPASAIPIHKHVYTHGFGAAPTLVVQVVNVAPKDSDKDGVADRRDDCPKVAGPLANGCKPEPPASSSSMVGVAEAPATTSVAPAPVSTGSYAIPDYIVQCESGGDYGAVGPGTTDQPYGAYQIKPSTSGSYGCDMSTPAGQDACAAEIYADQGSAPWACG